MQKTSSFKSPIVSLHSGGSIWSRIVHWTTIDINFVHLGEEHLNNKLIEFLNIIYLVNGKRTDLSRNCPNSIVRAIFWFDISISLTKWQLGVWLHLFKPYCSKQIEILTSDWLESHNFFFKIIQFVRFNSYNIFKIHPIGLNNNNKK